MIRILLLYLVVTLLTAGCSTIRVSQDFEQDVPFQNYTSFNWFLNEPTGNKGENYNPLLHNRFKKEIETALIQKGLAVSTHPSLLISYDYSVTSKIQSHQVSPTFGFGYGTYGRYGSIGIYSSPEIYQYDQGKLVINIYDAETKRILWRGKGTGVSSPHPTPDEITQKVRSLVYKILDQFPPQ